MHPIVRKPAAAAAVLGATVLAAAVIGLVVGTVIGLGWNFVCLGDSTCTAEDVPGMARVTIVGMTIGGAFVGVVAAVLARLTGVVGPILSRGAAPPR